MDHCVIVKHAHVSRTCYLCSRQTIPGNIKLALCVPSSPGSLHHKCGVEPGNEFDEKRLQIRTACRCDCDPDWHGRLHNYSREQCKRDGERHTQQAVLAACHGPVDKWSTSQWMHHRRPACNDAVLLQSRQELEKVEKRLACLPRSTIKCPHQCRGMSLIAVNSGSRQW